MSDTPADGASSAGQTAAAISAAVIALLHDYTGHRPTLARTTIDDDTIVVTLRDSLTKAECSLIAHGKTADVLAMRRAYEHAMRDDLIAIITRLTGRSVDALLSDHLHDPDVAIAVFLTGPGANDAPAQHDG